MVRVSHSSLVLLRAVVHTTLAELDEDEDDDRDLIAMLYDLELVVDEMLSRRAADTN